MIEAMIDIGNILMEKSDIVNGKIQKIKTKTKNGLNTHVIKINFDVISGTIQLDIEETDEHTAEKYLFLGRFGGPNNPQWYLTFDKCNNLISQSLPNFIEKLEAGELKETIKTILDKYFIDFGSSVDHKYRYLLNLNKFTGLTEDIYQLLSRLESQDKKNAYKNLIQNASKEFAKYCENKFELSKDQIALYTIYVGGQPIVKNQQYIQLVYKELENRVESKNDKLLKCSVCGSEDGCTSDLKDIKIKYYTTNQCIFANKFNQTNYDKNFVLCRKCYQNLQCAENFIDSHLKTRINSYDAYIIPHVIYGKLLSGDKFKNMAEVIQPVFDISKNINEIGEYRYKVEERLNKLNKEGYYFLLNFLFFKKLQQATKIQKMIKDVQPSIFCMIQDALYYSADVFKKHFCEAVTEQVNKIKDLKIIYFMHPIKLKDGGPVQYQKLLWVYEDIFYRRKIHQDSVFSNITEVFQIVWREREGYNVSSTKQQYFVFKIIEAMYYINFLKNYGCLEGGEGMDVSMLNLSEETKEYIKDMGYDEQQTALFLLGMLVGSIGRKQDEMNDGGTYKPILNKINFNGMDKTRITRLATDVFKKLRQEKILGEYNNEAIYDEFCRLFGKEQQRWNLNKNESLFYLLSGYAYQTLKKSKGRMKEND